MSATVPAALPASTVALVSSYAAHCNEASTWTSADRDVVDALTRPADLETDPTCEHLFRRRMHLYADHHHYQAVHNCYAELVDHLHIIGARPEQRTIHLYRRLISQAG